MSNKYVEKLKRTTLFNLSAEDMLKDRRTLTMLKELGDKNSIKYWIENYHAKSTNYKPSTYYRVLNTGINYAGVGKGLYLGRDKQALSNFYDLEQEGLPIVEYKGNPKWLDLMDYARYRKFARTLLNNSIEIINSNEVGEIVIGMGYDGIKYYDPFATGEEFVLFNIRKVRLVST